MKRSLSFQSRLQPYIGECDVAKVSPLFCYRLCILALNKAAEQLSQCEPLKHDRSRLSAGELKQLEKIRDKIYKVGSRDWRGLALALIDDIELVTSDGKRCFLPGTKVQIPEGAFEVWQKLSPYICETDNGRPRKSVYAIGIYEFVEHLRSHFQMPDPADACKHLAKVGPPFLDEAKAAALASTQAETEPLLETLRSEVRAAQHLKDVWSAVWTEQKDPYDKGATRMLSLYMREAAEKDPPIPLNSPSHYTLGGLLTGDERECLQYAERVKKMREDGYLPPDVISETDEPWIQIVTPER